jgi:hypothetical protein
MLIDEDGDRVASLQHAQHAAKGALAMDHGIARAAAYLRAAGSSHGCRGLVPSRHRLELSARRVAPGSQVAGEREYTPPCARGDPVRPSARCARASPQAQRRKCKSRRPSGRSAGALFSQSPGVPLVIASETPRGCVGDTPVRPVRRPRTPSEQCPHHATGSDAAHERQQGSDREVLDTLPHRARSSGSSCRSGSGPPVRYRR